MNTTGRFNYLKLLPVLICLLSFALCWWCIHPGHNWGDDFALYIQEAISISKGELLQLYEQNKYSVERSEVVLGPYLYPPGFPLILAPVYLLAGLNFWVMKVVCALFFVASLAVIYRLFKDKPGHSLLGIFLLVIIGFHSAFCTFSDNILADFPFLFFTYFSILLIERKNSTRNNIFLGLVLSFTLFLKPPGLFLIPVLFAYQFFYQRETLKELKTYIPYLVVAFTVLLMNLLLPSFSGNHYSQLGSNFNFSTISSGFMQLIDQVAIYFFPGEFSSTFQFRIWQVFIFGIITAGIFISFKKCKHLILFLFLNIFLLSLWPHTQGVRLVFPIIPVVAFFFLSGLNGISERLCRGSGYILIGAYSLVIMITSTADIYKFHYTETNQAATADSKEMYDFIVRNTQPEDEIIFFKPRLLHLMTGRNSFYISGQEEIMKSGGDYLISYKPVDSLGSYNTPVFENDKFVVHDLRSMK